MNATKTYEAVKSDVEQIVNSDPHSMETMEPLDEWRQGDVRVIRLPDNFDLGEHCETIKKVPAQLAPGNTLGSRHCLDSIKGIKAYRLKNGNELDGPVLRLKEPRTITHPEHGDCLNLPLGLYAFPGQRVYAKELRRTQD
jgi:hypothetical protein